MKLPQLALLFGLMIYHAQKSHPLMRTHCRLESKIAVWLV
jgi:hypothetical protein